MIAVVFPGQGSQKPGMGRELFETVPKSREVFEDVERATQIKIADLCFTSDEVTLRLTQNAQIALYTAGLAAYQALLPSLPAEHFLAGHSVGEYAAVAAAGAMSIETGAKLVQRRGELMSVAGKSRPGTMAAVLGLNHDALESVCCEASTEGEVAVIANDNCPGQLVISGDVAAIERANVLAVEKGAKRVLPINVSGAFHSPLMEDSAVKMAEALRQAEWNEQKLVVYANVTGDKVEHGREWVDLFERQLKSPVCWRDSIESMIRDGVDTFVECGSGEVLCGLIKRINQEVRTLKVIDAGSLEQTIAELSQNRVEA